MKRWLILLAAGLLIVPLPVLAADSGSSSGNVPPVAQTLVREGDFAIKLAADLDLGKPTDEVTAENLLVTAGIAPTNGWISDYPVTPQIVGQLDEAIGTAASNGKLKKNAQEATDGLHRLVADMNLPEPAPQEAASSAPAPAEAPAAPTVVNNYYYDTGPPVITYYAPPADYLYLYDWVPYPVFWFGFWFPGYYICHNFTTTVVVTQPFVTWRGAYTRTAIVSNRFVDPVTRRVVTIDPVVRSGGVVRPMTVLRGGGRPFMTVADMHRGTALTNVAPIRTGSTFRNTGTRSGFGSPEATRSANSIYSRSIQGMSPRYGASRGSSIERYRGSSGYGRTPGYPAARGGGESRYQRGSGGPGYTAPGRQMRYNNSSGYAPARVPSHTYNGNGFTRSVGMTRSFSGPARTGGSPSWFSNRGHGRG